MCIGSSLELSLLDENGDVHLQGGLNWGYSDGHTCLEDAYIPLRMETIRNNPNFFNSVEEDNRIYVTWDDSTEMTMLLEGRQSNLINGHRYAKQISSFNDKSILGHYIRRRIGIFGRKIILEDLENYGRTSITVTKTGANSYNFDFSN